MRLQITKPEYVQRLPGILLAAALALFTSGCDTTDRAGSEPPVTDREQVRPGTAQDPGPGHTVRNGETASLLPAAGSGTAAAVPDTQAPGTFDIRLHGDRIMLLANAAPARDIIDGLAVLTGFEVIHTDTPLERVTLAIEHGDLHAVLVAVLQPRPYQIIYEFDNTRGTDILTRVVVGRPPVMSETAAAQPCPPVTGIATLNPEGPPLPDAGQAPLSAEDQAYLSLLLDPSPKVRADAAESIEASGIALDYLARIITTDPSPEVRVAATYSLENSEDPRAVDTLITGLNDADPGVLVEVIYSLEFLDNRSAVPYLQPLLDHPDEDVRDAAESAIESLR